MTVKRTPLATHGTLLPWVLFSMVLRISSVLSAARMVLPTRGRDHAELFGVFRRGESGRVFAFDVDIIHDRAAQRGGDPAVGDDLHRWIDRFERITEAIAGGKEDLWLAVHRRQRRR